MISDSFTVGASVPSIPKDFGKKKRANRSAKLKQYKLDARREQWLSQIGDKNKQRKEEFAGQEPVPRKKGEKEQRECLGRRESMDGNKEHVYGLISHGFDLDSPSNSPNSVLVLGGANCDPIFGSSSSSISGSSAGCCSESISEEEGKEGDDNCLDDWELMADALAASDGGKHENPCTESVCSPKCDESTVGLGSAGPESAHASLMQSRSLTPKLAPGNSRAWRPDDAFRPQSLPNLSKQWSFPNTGRHFGPWASSSANVPSSCPICYEDLDLTDTSFLPCCCGFRLCLFCHKRILEDNGRCPGCRKPYECEFVEAEASVEGGSLTLKLARSTSMITRS